MKQLIAVAVTAFVVGAGLVALTVPGTTVYTQEVVTETVVKNDGLTPAQTIWLAKLMKCESGVSESAVNPNDLDNTPSYGILQFKPTTLSAFTVKYGIERNDNMDAEAQVAVVTHWLLNPKEVQWERQFPGCVNKLGKPPLPGSIVE